MAPLPTVIARECSVWRLAPTPVRPTFALSSELAFSVALLARAFEVLACELARVLAKLAFVLAEALEVLAEALALAFEVFSELALAFAVAELAFAITVDTADVHRHLSLVALGVGTSGLGARQEVA